MAAIVAGLAGGLVATSNYVAAADLPFEGGEFVRWVPDAETVAELFE